jgi:DNA-binding XRE family transcriptional regulator
MDRFDACLFAAYIRTKYAQSSLHEAAAEIGTSAATLMHLEREEVPDMEIFLRMCDWLQMPVREFFRDSIEPTDYKGTD